MYLPISDRPRLAAPAPPADPSGEEFATYINLSGRRRFTSQRVVLYAVLAAKQDPLAVDIATQALKLFRDAHACLMKACNGASGQFTAVLRDAYFGPPLGHEKILAFIDLAERVLNAIESGWRHQASLLLDELIESATPLLATLNSLTAIYEEQARCHAKKVEHQLLEAMGDIKTISKHAQVVAMNARIVAARAGSAGREFAVVATELISITSHIETILDTAMVKPA
ncbi:methyl-accepting chemotaxis protein [Rhodoferax sp.]|uniref:methyl-accepting chemotaxis protein n=1 Tax=Rhodoferax sp. TaxID=50421 RepID=UPI001EB372B1|nr:methyl-accepting chemotaxis protein [Rhodoferax sp.]MBT9505595.1 methyl-accepting chemotaxis protein [Rhodoferax sp.]